MGDRSSLWCPITKITQDHVFTILLLLPVDSVVSFGMTCKRYKCLASCDSLWESICRRDWGGTTVDAITVSSSSSSSATNNHISWLNLYKRFSLLDSLSCHQFPNSLLPTPRASHSLNFVSDSLVLFGGGCEGGRHLDDTWIAYIGTELPRTLRWQKVESGVPSGRFGHTCVVIGGLLVLFGGINDRGMRQNDTWIGQIDNLHISLSWRLLNVQSLAPTPRGAHAACSTDQRKMVIQGGIGLNGLRLGDTWVLELSENLCFGTWHELVIHPSPAPRSGHSLTCVGGSGLVLFGGRGSGYEVLSDVWLLRMCENQLKWVEMMYEVQNIPEGISLPRVGHSAALILGGRILIYGGEDSGRHKKDDFWVLDMSSIISNQMKPANIWKCLKAKGYKPECRSFHQACADISGRHMFVFGGMVNAEAGGLRFDGDLFLLQLQTLP